MTAPQEGMVPGRGAWTVTGHDTGSRYYLFKTLSVMDGRYPAKSHAHSSIHWATKGLQKAINNTGYRHPVLGPIPVTGVLGPRTQWGIKSFQQSRALSADGVVGARTAKALFVPLVRFYCSGVMGGVKIPAGPILGMFDLESGFDPGAVSSWFWPVNGPDRGLAQINQNAHPSITDEMAFDPFVSIPYAVWRYHEARLRFSGKTPSLLEYCSVAQHNSPLAAKQWYESGVAPNDQIAKYVQLVLARAAAF